ncbi:hypothetical protein WUBG_10113 [Wuchereria bancrofti]|uniref:Uncharacterized protein n=1 Tax=Wuchereria bancrofti TaxID=6293 RepID=J9EA03_WUCBA|nr:hypothetical protein WUBG_10113 [Wuchereria bancrofti]
MIKGPPKTTLLPIYSEKGMEMSIHPDGLPLVTSGEISLLQKNAQPAVSHQLQNKLKAKHPLMEKLTPDGQQSILLSKLLRKLFSLFDVAMLCYSKQPSR